MFSLLHPFSGGASRLWIPEWRRMPLSSLHLQIPAIELRGRQFTAVPMLQTREQSCKVVERRGGMKRHYEHAAGSGPLLRIVQLSLP